MNALSYGTAAALVLGLTTGSAGPAAAAEPLEATMAPDPLATNGGTFTVVLTSAPACPESCPTANGNIVLKEESTLDVTFHRQTTDLTIPEGSLAIEDFEATLGSLAIDVMNATIVTDPDPEIVDEIWMVGGNSGPFTLTLAGLVSADVSVGPVDESFTNEPVDIPVEGTFTFDPVLGTFAITEVGSAFGPIIQEVDNPFNPSNPFVFEISGEVELNFAVSGVLDVFGEDFENGDTGGWSVVVPRI